MFNISKWTTAREKYLSDLIHQKQESLKNVPAGFLRANQHGKHVQFYIRTSETGPNGRYLRKTEKPLVRALAQKEYDKRIVTSAKKELSLLNRLNHFYASNDIVESQYFKESKAKQPEILPILLPDEQFIDKWLSTPYTKLDISNNANGYFSDNEEQMRSKSEVIIANMLKKNNVPYRYECPLKLDGRLVYPDFTILNVSLRKEIYWEHLGMLDDRDYLESNLMKIARYEMNGYFPGDRLILTYETTNVSLNMKQVDILIKKFCL